MKSTMVKEPRKGTEIHGWSVDVENGGTISISVQKTPNHGLLVIFRAFNDYDHGDEGVMYRLDEAKFRELLEDAYNAEYAFDQLKAGKTVD